MERAENVRHLSRPLIIMNMVKQQQIKPVIPSLQSLACSSASWTHASYDLQKKDVLAFKVSIKA